MSCRDYADIDELKAIWPGATALSDTALALMLFGASDYLDKAVFGHSFNRAVRIYHDKTHGAAGCTVTVTAAQVDIIITGGLNAGTHTFTFAAYPTVQELVDAIGDHDIGVQSSGTNATHTLQFPHGQQPRPGQSHDSPHENPSDTPQAEPPSRWT